MVLGAILATAAPGFTVDEDEAGLGQALKLPSWLEEHRADIESMLRPNNPPVWQAPAGL